MSAPTGTGIAGAMDHQAAQPGDLACIVCGTEISGAMKGNPHARAVPGTGIIHACSDACAQDPKFAQAAGPEVEAVRAQQVALTNEVATLYFRLGQAAGDANGLRQALQTLLDNPTNDRARQRAEMELRRTLTLSWLPDVGGGHG